MLDMERTKITDYTLPAWPDTVWPFFLLQHRQFTFYLSPVSSNELTHIASEAGSAILYVPLFRFVRQTILLNQ